MKGLFTEVWAALRKLIRGDEAPRASYHPRHEGGKRAGCQELWLWELAAHPTGLQSMVLVEKCSHVPNCSLVEREGWAQYPDLSLQLLSDLLLVAPISDGAQLEASEQRDHKMQL